jgi:4-hydroxybenzoate polyprenyltransferase
MPHWWVYFGVGIYGLILAEGLLQPAIAILFLLTTLAFYLAFSFSINECFDVAEDKLNPKKKNPIARGKISFKKAYIYSILLALSGMIISSYFGSTTLIYVTAMAAIAYFYSATPLRLKSRFLLDIFSHGLFFGAMIFLLPFVAFGSPIGHINLIIAATIFHLSLIWEIRNHLSDYESDKKADLKTTVCVLGKGKSEKLFWWLVALYPVSLLLFLTEIQGILIAIYLIATIAYYFRIFLKKEVNTEIYAGVIYCAYLLSIII